MDKKDILVVVLSRNYSTGVSVIRSLGEEGYTVDLVASAKEEGKSKLASSSKYVRNAAEFVSEKIKSGENPEIINKLLEYKDSDAKALVLLPTDDYTASLVDKNQDVLKDIFKMPGTLAEGKDLVTFMNKQIQCQMAEAACVKAPKCWVVSLRGELKVPEDLVYPCYMKPIESFSGYKREMKTCHSPEEVLTHMQKLQERLSDRDFLIQEFVNIDEEIDIEGVAMGDEVVLSGVVHKSIIAKWDIGVPLAGEMVSFDQYPGLKEKVLDIVKAYNYQGMFDLGINVVGGEYYFNEMNLRSGGTNFVYNRSGVNLADIFVQKILGQEVEPEKTVIPETGKTYIYEMMALEDFTHGLLDKETLDKWMNEADIKIMDDENDPEPNQVFLADMASAVRRENYRIKIAGAAAEEKGWTREEALEDYRAARDEVGATLRSYYKTKLWRYEGEERKEVHGYFIGAARRTESIKQEVIEKAVDATGWTEEQVEKHLKEARELTGITYKAYSRFKFWEYEPSQQIEAYKEKIGPLTNKKKKVVPTEEKPLIVVLSRNYSTGLAVIRSLGSAGYPVDLVASAYRAGNSTLAACSKYVCHSVESVSKKVSDGADLELLDALLAYRDRYDIKPILFATDDYTASIMDLNKDKLSKIFVMPEILGKGQGSIVESMSKNVQSAIAREVGLPTPKEWIIDLMTIDRGLPQDIVYPCFCKPMESITGYKTEMARCDSEEALLDHLRTIRGKFAERSVLVQEFLQIDNEIDLGGVCFDQEIIIPAIIKKTMVAKYEKGVTLAGKVVPYEELGEIQEKTKEMLRKFHYVGMFDMEFNVVGDKLYFNEINFRSGGPNFSYFMSGVNLPEIFVKAVTGQEISEEEKQVAEFGKSFIYEKVAWDDFIHGFMSRNELDTSIAESDIRLLLNEEDPVPGEFFIQKMENAAKMAKKKKFKNGIKAVLKFILAIMKVLFRGWEAIRKHTPWCDPQDKKKNARNSQSENPRAIVAGRNYLSNLCMAKSLGEGGYDVEVVKIFQKRPKLRNIKRYIKPDKYSKYVKAYYTFVSDRIPENIRDFFVKISDPNRKMLLVPCDDLIASVVDEFYNDLKEYYILPNVNDTEGQVNYLMEKDVQKRLAKEAGLPVIGSTVIKSEGGEFEIPDTVNYPCFIKPNVSKNSAKAKMKKCDNRKVLRNTLESYARRKDFEMIVEDFVDIKREFSILGVSTKDGANGPGYFGAVAGGQIEHRGVAVTGEIIPVSAEQELIDKCVAFVGSLGFDGLYDIDLIQDVNGKMYFVEVNMRFGASGYAYTKLGCNLPKMYADYMAHGTPIDMNAVIEKTGDIFVSEKVLVEEYTSGRLTKTQYNQYMKEADIHFIKDADDKKPYRHFRRALPILGIIRKMYIAKGK